MSGVCAGATSPASAPLRHTRARPPPLPSPRQTRPQGPFARAWAADRAAKRPPRRFREGVIGGGRRRRATTRTDFSTVPHPRTQPPFKKKQPPCRPATKPNTTVCRGGPTTRAAGRRSWWRRPSLALSTAATPRCAAGALASSNASNCCTETCLATFAAPAAALAVAAWVNRSVPSFALRWRARCASPSRLLARATPFRTN